MHLSRIAVCTIALLLGSTALLARDFHLTVDGTGSRDGASWENAYGSDALQRVFNETMQPGDRLLLGGGTYPGMKLVISRGGEAEKAKEIVGMDLGTGLPLFSGTWSVESPTKGATAIHIEPGVSHVTLRGIRMQGYVFGIHAPEVKNAAGRSHLIFDNLKMEQFRYGFFLADCDDVQLHACELRRYTKHAFRFEQGCDRVTLRQCVADCSEGDADWETKTELFPFGYHLGGEGIPNTSFVFEDCRASNHLMPLQTTKYLNGDGFVVEQNATDVQFLRCRAIRNQDGGFDLKTREVRLTDCLALGNSRGFRIWNTGTLDNCLAGWGNIGLWNNGGPVRASRCTFHELKKTAVQTDDSATLGVTLEHCLITGTAEAHRNTAKGTVALQGTIVTTTTADASYPKADKTWDGTGNAMDSGNHPDKGYRSTLRSNVQRQ